MRWLAGALLVSLAGGLLLISPVGCRKPPERRTSKGPAAMIPAERPVLLASIEPLGAIIAALAGNRADVHVLLPTGVSPHTFEPRPSDAALAQRCDCLFYIDMALDGWATELAAPARVAVFEMVAADSRLPLYGDHGHGRRQPERGGTQPGDPHFWTDPRLVRQILPALTAELERVDPAGAADYQRNADNFAAELDALDRQLRELLAPFAGEPVVLFHPSMRYFLRAYNLVLATVIEAAPGKEPSPADLAELVELVRVKNIRAIFSEPQLPPRAVEAVSEAAGVGVYVLDPLGAGDGAQGYQDLLRRNADTLARALAAPAE